MKKRILILLLVFLVSINVCQAAIIKGEIYDPDLNKMTGRVEIWVDSYPRQYMVSTDGTYSFFLLVGEYTINAKYEERGRVKYEAEEKIVIRDQGEFIYDIVMHSVVDEEESMFNETTTKTPLFENRGILLFIIIGFVFLVSIVLVVIVLNKRKKKQEDVINLDTTKVDNVEPENPKDDQRKDDEIKREIEKEIPENLDGVLKVIKQSGGRTTQKDIRKKIPLSEAKISLMITELEHKGIVERIKKGRGNIIIMKKDPGSDEIKNIEEDFKQQG